MSTVNAKGTNVTNTDAKLGDSPTIMALFKNSMGSCVYIFKNGKPANFLQGRYFTNNEAEIEELMDEVKQGHPHIYIDQEEFLVDTKFVDPLEAIRAQILAELAAQGRLVEAGTSDFGTSDQSGKLTIGTTTSVAAAMSGSNSGAGSAGVAAPVSGDAKISLNVGK